MDVTLGILESFHEDHALVTATWSGLIQHVFEHSPHGGCESIVTEVSVLYTMCARVCGACVCVRVYVCMCVCLYVFVCVCVCMYVHV